VHIRNEVKQELFALVKQLLRALALVPFLGALLHVLRRLDALRHQAKRRDVLDEVLDDVLDIYRDL
jgi:hypothetical protein